MDDEREKLKKKLIEIKEKFEKGNDDG